MTDNQTIAIFGAGNGLAASLATRFGREGYGVPLVARRAQPLEERVLELGRADIEATAFPGDLTDQHSAGFRAVTSGGQHSIRAIR
jgi:short-subunit dehydrogenase